MLLPLRRFPRNRRRQSKMSFTTLRVCPRPAALPSALRSSRTFTTSLRVKSGEQVLKGYSEAAPGTLNRHSRLITQDKTQGASQVGFVQLLLRCRLTVL